MTHYSQMIETAEKSVFLSFSSVLLKPLAGPED